MSATMAARARNSASLSAPVRRPQQPARRRSSPWIARLLRSLAQNPGRALIFLAFGAATVAIVVNALMFQKARHPHPMLTASPSQAEPARAAVPARRTEQAPAADTQQAAAPVQPAMAVPALPPSRPSVLPQPERQSQPDRQAAPRPPAAVPAAARAAAPVAAPAVARPAPARDPIADLLNGGDMRPPADVGRAAPPRRSTGN